MRIVIVGGGIVGLALARMLRRAGIDPLVVERAPVGTFPPRPFMLPSQGFDALEAAGVTERVRAVSWEIAARPGAGPVALAADFVAVCEALADGVPVRHETTVTALERDGERVVGIQVGSEGAEERVAADLVVACDGIRSPVRGMAGLDADLTPAEAGHLSFMSPAIVDRSFAMAYQSDGRQVGLLGWPTGSAGWWDIDPIGREAAMAPGLDAFRRAFARLLPAAGPALAGLTSMDQLTYRDITEVRCPRWWVPGVVLIGDAAHSLGPEAGLGAGLGLGDALALSVAIARNPDDPDAACRDYEHWRRPATQPYELIGAAGARPPGARGGPRPPEERWPPVPEAP